MQYEGNNLLLSPDNSIHLNWLPSSIVPLVNPDDYNVDIDLYRYNPERRLWHSAATVASDIANTGSRTVTVPHILFDDNRIADVYPIAFFVTPFQRNDDFESRKRRNVESSPFLDHFRGEAGRWTTVLYYTVFPFLRRRCIDWCDSQPLGIGEEILNRVDPCPPLLQQARSSNSRLTEDSSSTRRLSNQFFHPEAQTCFRQLR